MTAGEGTSVRDPDLRRPHSWSRGARCMSVPGVPAVTWLRDSTLPGTSTTEADTWPLPDRESFLRLLCGENAGPTDD